MPGPLVWLRIAECLIVLASSPSDSTAAQQYNPDSALTGSSTVNIADSLRAEPASLGQPRAESSAPPGFSLAAMSPTPDDSAHDESAPRPEMDGWSQSGLLASKADDMAITHLQNGGTPRHGSFTSSEAASRCKSTHMTCICINNIHAWQHTIVTFLAQLYFASVSIFFLFFDIRVPSLAGLIDWDLWLTSPADAYWLKLSPISPKCGLVDVLC